MECNLCDRFRGINQRQLSINKWAEAESRIAEVHRLEERVHGPEVDSDAGGVAHAPVDELADKHE